jgi:hypothetical protein
MTTVIKAYEKHAKARGPQPATGFAEPQGPLPDQRRPVSFPALEPCGAAEER